VSAEGGRIARFCVVGVSNTVVTLVAFVLLVRLGVPAPPASGLAFCAGAVNSYQLNRRWTFAGMLRTSHAWLRFTIAQATGALASAGGVLVLTNAGWPRLAAECVILPCVTAALYSVSRLLVFRSASV
jgi:putative flippase GtrA